MELLNINDVKKIYKLKNKEEVKALDGVSFSVKKGECIGLVGESGCGKSTLGKLIVGLEECSHGEILFKNKNVKNITRKDKFRKDLQMVFQDSLAAVNRKNTIEEIISEPLKNFNNLSKNDIRIKVEELLTKVGIDSKDKDKFPSQFSGGQLQRICIARALSMEPDLLVLDEPLSSLDVSIQAQILNLLSDLKEELGLTYILISHDLEAVYYLADSLVIMYKGKVMEELENVEELHKMKHPYTIRLLSSSYEYRQSMENNIIEDVGNNSEDVGGCPYYSRCNDSQPICKIDCPNLIEISDGHRIACHLNT